MTVPRPALRNGIGPTLIHALVVIALVVGLLGSFLVFSYRSTATAAEEAVSKEASLLAAKLEGTLHRIDMSLTTLREHHVGADRQASSGAAGGGADFLESHISQLSHKFPEVLAIVITDATGKVRASGFTEPPKWDLADREYFQQARSNPSETTLFSPALLAKNPSAPAVIGYQSIVNAAGEFDGVIAIAINLARFKSLLAGATTGSEGMVAVRRSDDSRLVMRWPEAPTQTNQPAPRLAPYVRVRAGERAGVVRGLSATEDVERIFGFQTLDDYPFFVVVGRGVDEQFALWERTALVAVAIAVATLALLLAVQLSLSRSRARLAQNEHHFDTLIDSRHEVSCVWLPDTTLLSCNLRYAQLLGKDASAVLGTRWIDFIAHDQQEATREGLRTLLAGPRALTTERRIEHPDGTTCWIRWLDQPLFDGDGRCTEIRSIGQDITQEKQNALRLRQLAQAVEQSPTTIVITNTDAVIEYANDAFTRTTGYLPEEVIGKNPRVLNAGRTPSATYQDLWATLARGEVWRGEFHNTRKDGSTYFERATIAPIKQADGTVTHYVAVKDDITERREAEARIQQLAYYDTLTGLPNRSLMWDRLGQSILASERSGAYGMLLLLDVDHFKLLNDTQGHETGDTLLREVARRLRAALRADDTVARLGDDDFAVVVEALGHDRDLAIAHAEKLAEQLHCSILAPFELGLPSGPYSGTPSIGITLFQGRANAAVAVLKQAEVALYRAKAEGRNTIRFFSESMQAVVDARAELEFMLRAAIAEGGFRLFYQPQLNRDGRVIGAEALIRCFDTQGKMISPASFIPLAEETGLIVPIGDWVLDAACAQLHAWQQTGLTCDYSLSVNVSAKQFHQPDFVSKVEAAVERHAIAPDKLKIELTESVVLGDIETTVDRMQQIKALGVKFALDDFGTGYSSLSYLKRLPFDQLKIDQIFVRDMAQDNSSEAIVRAILAISRSLDLEVVAEGVETPEQHELLLMRGCEMFQGYLFGKPVPIEAWASN